MTIQLLNTLQEDDRFKFTMHGSSWQVERIYEESEELAMTAKEDGRNKAVRMSPRQLKSKVFYFRNANENS